MVHKLIQPSGAGLTTTLKHRTRMSKPGGLCCALNDFLQGHNRLVVLCYDWFKEPKYVFYFPCWEENKR